MTTVTLDEATYAALARRAAARGLSVERWLAEELAAEPDDDRDMDESGEPGHRRGRSREEWNREFEAFLATVKSWNPDMDDSREAMYPVRPRLTEGTVSGCSDGCRDRFGPAGPVAAASSRRPAAQPAGRSARGAR